MAPWRDASVMLWKKAISSQERILRQFGGENDESHGQVLDLVLPILVLIVCCIIGMIYSGGFFDGVDFITAFSIRMHRWGCCLALPLPWCSPSSTMPSVGP